MSALGPFARGIRSGRSAFYKTLYCRGAFVGGGRQINSMVRETALPVDNVMSTNSAMLGGVDGKKEDLFQILRDIDGVWDFGTFLLSMDRIQPDPFAPPTRARLRVPQSAAGFPSYLFNNKSRNIGLASHIARHISDIITSKGYNIQQNGAFTEAKGGAIRTDFIGQEILQRSAVLVNPDWVEARITISLPAKKRTVLSEQALEIFSSSLPFLVRNTLYFDAYNPYLVKSTVECNEDQDFLRDAIVADNVVSFIPNGAILPRHSGASERPLRSPDVVPFQSPPSLEKTYILPNKGSITGMAIPSGITTIVGGGFHGKSTLLDAIRLGVWNHVKGDGREYIVTNPTAVGIRSEDGRSVAGVDISPFIQDLPGGADTTKWSSNDSSGSTSMAASLVEACELGSKLLLFDEDLCATNFMIRDPVMRKLVKKEPISPLIEKVRELYSSQDVSSIFAIGGCSDYLIADRVLLMENYIVSDVTEQAHSLLENEQLQRSESTFPKAPSRSIVGRYLFDPNGKSIKTRSKTTIQLGAGDGPDIDLSALSQIMHPSQTRLISQAIRVLNEKTTNYELKQTVHELIDNWEVSMLNGWGDEEGWLAAVRAIDVGMAVNRIRTLKIA